MKRNLISLCLCALVGPCITIHSERTWITIMEGKGDNTNHVGVTKEMDGKVESHVSAVEATATASANISTDGAKKVIKDEVRK